MTTTAITATTITATGYNLTDSSDFETMTAGAGNGVEFSYDANDIVILKNGTGGSVDFTIKAPTPATYSAKGITISDVTVTVADGKTWAYKLSAIFKQSDGDVIIECDDTADILILTP